MSSAAGRSAARGRRWSSPRASPFNRAASSQSRPDNPANNEGYTGSSETECKLSAPRAPNGHSCEDRDRGADGEQAEPAESDACDYCDTSAGENERENRNYRAQCEKHEGRQRCFVGG